MFEKILKVGWHLHSLKADFEKGLRDKNIQFNSITQNLKFEIPNLLKIDQASLENAHNSKRGSVSALITSLSMRKMSSYFLRNIYKIECYEVLRKDCVSAFSD